MTSSIIAKLVEARKEFQSFGKNRQAYNYKYADLDEIISKTGPALTAKGLSVHTSTETIEIGQKPWLIVTAHLSDELGGKLTASIPMPLESVSKAKIPAQDMGSIITYGRRYAYCALLNLTADEDIDADTEKKQDEPKTNYQSAKGSAVPQIKATQQIKSVDKRKEYWAKIKSYCEVYGQQRVLDALDIASFDLMNTWDDKKLDERMIDLSLSLI